MPATAPRPASRDSAPGRPNSIERVMATSPPSMRIRSATMTRCTGTQMALSAIVRATPRGSPIGVAG